MQGQSHWTDAAGEGHAGTAERTARLPIPGLGQKNLRPLNLRTSLLAVLRNVTILGSGSGGNSVYIETGETRLLIDAGLSARQIGIRLAQIGRTLDSISAILLTHEHGDHTNALSVLAKRQSIPVYCNRLTQEAVADQLGFAFPHRQFATGATFEIGDLAVESFAVPHDAQDPAGFMIRTAASTIGLVTDLGHVTRLVIERLRRANILILESNHDVQMLQDDVRRPWHLKQRILSRHGHLSNEAAAAAAVQLASEELQHLVLYHLSQDCNQPGLARQAVGEQLAKIGASHIRVETAAQDSPMAIFNLPEIPTPQPAV